MALRRARMPTRWAWQLDSTSARLSCGTHSRKTSGAAEAGQRKSSEAAVQSAVGGASSMLGPTIVSSSNRAISCAKYVHPCSRSPLAAACTER
eukprot:3191808-Rhodomonas_salina.1